MDAATPSKKPRTAAASASSPWKVKTSVPSSAGQFATPEKMKKVAAAASDLATPEKTEPRPLLRRGRSGGAVALSVKEVRRAALELHRAGRGPAAEADAGVDALESVERELGVGAGAGRSPVKRRPEVKLPESYEILCEFFNCFESSTRLLRMKGSKATFPNICASIQNLAERRFTYGHLAQLKYIMPEAIVINKILLRDDKTCCMKPDLQVNLLVDSVEDSAMQKGETRYSALRRMFRQRLVDFFRKHPEGDDIPEHELPYPFTQTKSSVAQSTPRVVTEVVFAAPSPSLAEQPAVALSHMSQSFKRRFSQRSSTCPATASTTGLPPKAESTAPSPLSRKSMLGSTSGAIGHESQVQEKSSKDVALKFGVTEGTPAKFASTPVRSMAATPNLETPKRPISATVCDTPPLQTVKRSARAKLFMTPMKDSSSIEEENQSTSTSDGDDELISFLPKSLLQSVKKKEKRALEEKETGFADQVQRQKLISCLPSTFDIIFLIYQSRQRTVLTKQELIHKIIESNPKVVDKGEVEEQVRLLLEFVPEWISEKAARNGDVLCCVNTALSQSEVRQRLYGVE
ncbi:CDT1-like protein a, chloroplastic [Hordeum vulgare subsp. vulgare]|uniref:CDT1-like protein a, chloroplastic n=1 Tax=Hordeum vulgare subsp. vulgare TaxID=112509 RepID=UPI001B849E6D|nr:CDT1-like protein a, chloroplastic [Hordeum vulgare subsp. vulgare]